MIELLSTVCEFNAEDKVIKSWNVGPRNLLKAIEAWLELEEQGLTENLCSYITINGKAMSLSDIENCGTLVCAKHTIEDLANRKG